MFRLLVCLAMGAALVGGEIAAFATSPNVSGADCRIAEHRPKRLRRLGNRLGTKHLVPLVQLDEVAADNNPASTAAAASEDPVKLNVNGGWNGSASTKHILDGESAAALFPANAPVGQTE
jgi:hypothetical protein